MSEHEGETREQRDARLIDEAWTQVRGNATNLFVSLIRLRNQISEGRFKKDVRQIIDTLREEINNLEKTKRG